MPHPMRLRQHTDPVITMAHRRHNNTLPLHSQREIHVQLTLNRRHIIPLTHHMERPQTLIHILIIQVTNNTFRGLTQIIIMATMRTTPSHHRNSRITLDTLILLTLLTLLIPLTLLTLLTLPSRTLTATLRQPQALIQQTNILSSTRTLLIRVNRGRTHRQEHALPARVTILPRTEMSIKYLQGAYPSSP